jgi:phospholipid/cholesterol/gamma-HCH transport system ATP-binding protein
MINFENVSKGFSGREVLKGVDLHCAEGETTVILGGSGAGKTVLMKHCLGLFKPDTGSVRVEDVTITPSAIPDLSHLREVMGVVFQQSALFDSMTVFENVAFPLIEAARLKISKSELADKVHNALSMFDLEDIDDLLPSELSGGMRKRVALARAIIRRPKILLYDEPTTGLDPITTAQVDEMILTAREKLGVTSLVISHDIGSAFNIADKIAFLYEGRILACGRPEAMRAAEVPELKTFLQTWWDR